MKRLLLFLLLTPLAFAAWQTVAATAIGISAAILAVIFMVGVGFSIQEMQLMAKEEFFQLVALGVLMIALVGTDSLLNGISTSPAFREGSAATMQESAKNMINTSIAEMNDILTNVRNLDKSASVEGSKAGQCNIMGMGYSVSGCGSYSMLATPISMSGGIIGFAIGELSAMLKLISIAEKYALQLLLPLGIVLRTVKLTRGAGGLLIALGVAMYIMLPAGIIFIEMMGAKFLASPDAADYTGGTSVNLGECNPSNAMAQTGGQTDNEINVINAFHQMKAAIRGYLFKALIKATLGPVVALLMMVTSIKALTSVAGAEVDVSAISRFV